MVCETCTPLTRPRSSALLRRAATLSRWERGDLGAERASSSQVFPLPPGEGGPEPERSGGEGPGEGRESREDPEPKWR
jgi:hypothetical protein